MPSGLARSAVVGWGGRAGRDMGLMNAKDVTAEIWASTLDALMDAAAAVLTADSLEQTLRRVVERLGGVGSVQRPHAV